MLPIFSVRPLTNSSVPLLRSNCVTIPMIEKPQAPQKCGQMAVPLFSPVNNLPYSGILLLNGVHPAASSACKRGGNARRSIPTHSGGVCEGTRFPHKPAGAPTEHITSQQVSPVVSIASASEKTHATACQCFVVGCEGTESPHPMRMKLSGLSLCQAGDWGLQTPQWEISVSFMRMGTEFPHPPALRYITLLPYHIIA